MLLCPSKIGFVQGSTSVVCCVVIYFLLLRVIGRYLRIPIHKKKMGILKFITLTLAKMLFSLLSTLPNCYEMHHFTNNSLFLHEDPQLLAEPYSFFPSALSEAFFSLFTIIHHVPSRWLEHQMEAYFVYIESLVKPLTCTGLTYLQIHFLSINILYEIISFVLNGLRTNFGYIKIN